MRKIAVLGLGRFGVRLAQELARSRVEVLAADRRRDLVEQVSNDAATAVQMDVTNEDALRAQDVADMDVCVVAIGEDFEAAVMATCLIRRLIREAGSQARLVARAQTAQQAEILRLVGADRVIQPESEMAALLARHLANPHIGDHIELDEHHSIVEVRAPRSFVGKTVGEMRLGARYRVNLLTIRRLLSGDPDDENAPRKAIRVPSEDEVIQANDVLVLLGENEALAALPQD